MMPWIIEEMERERREQEEAQRRLPLRIQQPPPEWIEEQERSKREHQEDKAPERGVWIIQL